MEHNDRFNGEHGNIMNVSSPKQMALAPARGATPHTNILNQHQHVERSARTMKLARSDGVDNYRQVVAEDCLHQLFAHRWYNKIGDILVCHLPDRRSHTSRHSRLKQGLSFDLDTILMAYLDAPNIFAYRRCSVHRFRRMRA